MCNLHLCAAPAFAALTTFLVAPALAQDTGNRVQPSTVRAWIESMSDVLERQAETPPDTRLGRAWDGRDGSWFIAPESAKTSTHSGKRAAINRWGDPCIGITFGEKVQVEELWLAGHGAAPAPSLRIVGFFGSRKVAESKPVSLSASHRRVRLGADFEAVDRIVFEAETAGGNDGRGFFALDDLRIRTRDGSSTVADFESLQGHTDLTSSTYAGFSWELGTGLREQVVRDSLLDNLDNIIDAPRSDGRANAPVAQLPQAAAATSGTPGSPIRVWEQFDGPRFGDAGATLFPPDTHGAVGPDFVIAIVNSNLSVYRRSDNFRALSVGLRTFWNFNQTIGDPRAVWDVHSQRFVVLATTFSTTSELYFAVSETADPTGNWFKFNVRADQGSDAGFWPDFPTLGVDRPRHLHVRVHGRPRDDGMGYRQGTSPRPDPFRRNDHGFPRSSLRGCDPALCHVRRSRP